MQNMMSVAEWARTLGISRQAADRAIKRCGIVRVNNKVDADMATALYQKNTRPRASDDTRRSTGAPSLASAAGDVADEPDNIPPYDVSRARREAAEAIRSEIQAAELADTFLDRGDVQSCVREVVRAMRASLQDCARRVALAVAPLATADECEAVIEREHRALLEGVVLTLAETIHPTMPA
ncbi:hypothetical protein HH212_12120 [Massilia forsythiae]|uniref:Uncharacterized protein n=1 Tax=Massilia forsythiae TaxID=2728020 RepID=A0A7Z2VX24_9BURK|nr:hypothetical protein [Massilia forsythiae]QJE00675.1 hypothetical protein HH212_12120 [Massilia forsythiae]